MATLTAFRIKRVKMTQGAPTELGFLLLRARSGQSRARSGRSSTTASGCAGGHTRTCSRSRTGNGQA